MSDQGKWTLLEAESKRLRQLNLVLQAQRGHQKSIDEHIEHLMRQAGIGAAGDGNNRLGHVWMKLRV